MAVSREDVLRVAALARLELAEPEVERLCRDLSAILEHVEELHALEIPVEPDRQTTGGADLRSEPLELRGDEPGSDSLASPPGDFAPEFRDGFYTVPRLASHAAAELREKADTGTDGDRDGDLSPA